MTTDSVEDPGSAMVVTGKITPWFIKRMLMMLGLFVFLSGFFFYDWKVGYPAKKAEYEAAMEEYTKFSDEKERLVAIGDQQGVEAAQKAWVDLSAEKEWEIDRVDLSPDNEVTSDDIQEQFNFGVGSGVLAVGVLIWMFLNLGKKLSVDGDSVTLPNGRNVKFADIHKVDTRRWGNKGLATIYYKDQAGSKGSARIDGLKYGGFIKPEPFIADQILGRIVQGFDGELIELQEEDETAPNE
ncbi:hypothetical protein [Sulfuriroseicoccus oceanibius]|uniref:Uncharacterized protein n=1 Tax=Sulfuriroseicoccus oceanibius TaxID=2707525 RepID=A0A6B3L105_9BACT|nr:hypothetical protein [Sulfuriroseicoccus oceanibius]QQL44183.1 hypothetical protein G3M56_009780 [Sulfuriroseicoccus oceanibius]